MKKIASYCFFSALIVFSGTFGIAPMAFCTMKAEVPHSHCCNTPAPAPKCPICVFDQNKIYPHQANVSIKSSGVSRNVIAILPQESALGSISEITHYQLAHPIDTSPPLYLQFGILRL